MPYRAVGSDESLCKLIAIAEDLQPETMNLRTVWKAICRFTNDGGGYTFYDLCDYDPEKPASQFLDDLGRLVQRGFLEPGKIRLTGPGRFHAWVLSLPESLEPIRELLVESYPLGQ